MHMPLSRRGDRAVRASIDLARHWDSVPRKTREIATSMDIPPQSLRQILADLVAHGILTSTAGPGGGYSLAQPPEEVTLLSIIEAAEGGLILDQCVLRGGPCDWTEACPIHDTWSNAHSAFADPVAATSLADLAHIDHNIESGTHTWTDAKHLKPTPRRGTRA
jgi:Rrf2 family protein